MICREHPLTEADTLRSRDVLLGGNGTRPRPHVFDSFGLPSAKTFIWFLERSQEIENRLFVAFGELFETLHNSVRFRRSVSVRPQIFCRIVSTIGKTSRGMVFDSDKQIAGASVVEKKKSLPNSPERRRSKFIRSRITLNNVVGECGTHMVEQ